MDHLLSKERAGLALIGKLISADQNTPEILAGLLVYPEKSTDFLGLKNPRFLSHLGFQGTKKPRFYAGIFGESQCFDFPFWEFRTLACCERMMGGSGKENEK